MNSRAFKHLRPFALVTQRGKRGFTLVELLAVMALVAILLAVAMPAVTGIGKGSSMQAAISNVRTTISLARQYAVTKRATVYVVFPNSNTVYTAEEDAALVARGYAVFEVFDSNTGDGQYLTEWRMLPSGIIFDTENADGSSVFAASNKRRVRFPRNDSPLPGTTNMNVLAILPSGALSGGLGTGRVYLREGQSMPVGNTPNITPTGDTLFQLEANPFTGSVRVRDLTP